MRRKGDFFRWAAGVCVGACLLLPSTAGAATILVTSTATNDDQLNAAPDGVCSLREAVQSINGAANFGSCVATIAPNPYGTADEIDLPAGTFPLTRAGAGEDANSTGDLDITKAVKILGTGDGPGGTRIDANHIDRALDLRPVAATVNVTVQELLISNGNVPGVADDGGAIRVGDLDGSIAVKGSTITGSNAGHKGGAIFFEGATSASTPIDIVDTELVGNTAGDDGGAIEFGNSSEQAAILRSSLIGNSAGGEGGGVYLSAADIGPFPSIRITNSTLAGNSAVGGGGAVGLGGGKQQVFTSFSTYAGNTTPAAGQGGAFRTDTGGATADEVYLSRSILAGNTAAGAPASCGGPAGLYPVPYGNVVSDSSCPLVGTNNLLGTDPLLAPLAANGGSTRTMGLYDTSPAIDHIPTANCTIIPMTDQRAQPRPVGGACDAGAFEGSVGPKPVPGVSTNPPKKKKKCKKKKKKKRAAEAKKKKCKKKRKK
ncbi:MAG: hypothetical protein QOD60_1424 [Solirubrobacterales bacterium]|nr:hypothetical protein [Solirubrobacterales bacterium]